MTLPKIYHSKVKVHIIWRILGAEAGGDVFVAQFTDIKNKLNERVAVLTMNRFFARCEQLGLVYGRRQIVGNLAEQ